MLEFMTMAVLLFAGACGGAAIAIVCMLRRKVEPDYWTVVEGWEGGCSQLFSDASHADRYINSSMRAGIDASDWVVRGVVLVREEGDPRG